MQHFYFYFINKIQILYLQKSVFEAEDTEDGVLSATVVSAGLSLDMSPVYQNRAKPNKFRGLGKFSLAFALLFS